MRFEPFDLLRRVDDGHAHAKYNLSTSDMPPTRLSEVGRPADLLLSENHVGGGPDLRSLLARRFGGSAEDYIVTCGASEANFAVPAGLVAPGDKVLVESPVYQPLLAIPQGLGARVQRVERLEENRFGLTADEVRRAMPPGLRLLSVTNLHNPSGGAIPASEVRAIADLAAQEGFYVHVDEIFRELAFEKAPPTMGGLNERVVVTSSVSKFYGAGGLRIGWIRAAPEARARIRQVLDYLSIAPAGISEAIAIKLLKKKDVIATRNKRLIRDGRKAAAAWAEGTPGVAWEPSTCHLTFPRLPVDSAALADRLLAKYDTFLAPGESFGLPKHFRFNVGLGADRIEEGLRRVTRALAEA